MTPQEKKGLEELAKEGGSLFLRWLIKRPRIRKLLRKLGLAK